MKVFVAGGTGVIGRRLIPRLIEQGHDVVALVRTPDKRKHVEELGAASVVGDALDETALVAAVRQAEPEVIIHQLTSHGGLANFKKLDEDFRVTNRLRTEATRTMLEAARLVGTRRGQLEGETGARLAAGIRELARRIRERPVEGPLDFGFGIRCGWFCSSRTTLQRRC